VTKDRVMKVLELLGRLNDPATMDERLEELRREVNAMPREEYENLIDNGPPMEAWVQMGIATVRFFQTFKKFWRIVVKMRPIVH
jgi:hypothetical protein